MRTACADAYEVYRHRVDPTEMDTELPPALRRYAIAVQPTDGSQTYLLRHPEDGLLLVLYHAGDVAPQALWSEGDPVPRVRPQTAEAALQLYPRLVAHVIAESSGYAVPVLAARIILDARDGRPNWCEWIDTCYGQDARLPVRGAIGNRHHHSRRVRSYQRARTLVAEASAGADHSDRLAAWF